MKSEGILVVDYGSQYNELVARRIRQAGVYSEICSFANVAAELTAGKVLGIVLTGGPKSVYGPDAYPLPAEILEAKLPVLGICYGLQLLTQALGGKVSQLKNAEYGKAIVTLDDSSSPLAKGLPSSFQSFMSHRDCVTVLAPGFTAAAHTPSCPVAIAQDTSRQIYGVQFHPEVTDTEYGQQILENFLFGIVKAAKNWSLGGFVAAKANEIRTQVGSESRILLGLSGGVDSSVTAAILSRAVGRRLVCVFVNHGLLRKNEAAEVLAAFKGFDLELRYVDASKEFFAALAGVADPESKRKIIGRKFIDVFDREAKKLGHIDFLAQGTIYPDVVESGLGGNSAKIKSHHNVGGLPKELGFKGLVEPLRYLFKDEVRALGTSLGLPESLVWRQPFPGPGLGIRIIGEVTPLKAHIVQEADAIFREEVKKAGLDRKISQYYAALTNMRTVGVEGDGRSYDYAVVLRAVKTIDFMTAKPYEIPFAVLQTVADRIVDEVPNVNRVMFDCTSKPPATIELE